MQIKTYRKTIAENATPGKARDYRKAPGSFDAAAREAVRIAKRDGEEIAIIPGNSYGTAVYRIARLSEDLATYTIGAPSVIGATATPAGLVRMAELTR